MNNAGTQTKDLPPLQVSILKGHTIRNKPKKKKMPEFIKAVGQ